MGLRMTYLLGAVLLLLSSLTLEARGEEKTSLSVPVDSIYFLTEELFIRDALKDAIEYGNLNLRPDSIGYNFNVYQGFYVDLDLDGEQEYVVSGEIAGQSYNLVMVYWWHTDHWNCRVLNRSVGGGINAIQVIDVDNDGRSEIFSVLQDHAMRRICKVHRCDKADTLSFHEVFNYVSEGGWTNSQNFSLYRPQTKDSYTLRVDEIIYQDEEEGDVRQNIYLYRFKDGIYVLDKKIEGGVSYQGKN